MFPLQFVNTTYIITNCDNYAEVYLIVLFSSTEVM